VADAIESATLRDLFVGGPGIEANNSNLQIDGVETSGDVRFNGASAGWLHGSKVANSVKVHDAASPDIGINFIGGDVEFTSTGAMKLDGNAIQGILFLPSALPPALSADLVKRNLFSAKKPIQLIQSTGVRPEGARHE
jgi:hypothetical protein